jgi:hypothetical protein
MVARNAVDAMVELHEHANRQLVRHPDLVEAIGLIEHTFQYGMAQRLARYMERDR